MRLADAACIDDLRLIAKRRLPDFVFDYMDGGAESEAGLARNRAAFRDILLKPRYLVDCSRRDMTMDLFGRTYRQPFGISPVGLANLIWPGTDLMLVRAAAEAGMPYILSSAGTTSLEDIAKAGNGHAWFQLYIANREEITDDLIRRAGAAGYEVLVVTVDIPIPGKRNRDIRNRFQLPFRLSPKMIAELALHPLWSAATARAGMPRFENIIPYAEAQAGAQSLAAMMASTLNERVDWAALARVRARWPGKLVIKGILAPEDAARCRAEGMDGIIVSNHGGRQADYAPASIEALPHVRAAVGPDFPVMLDSGIRQGADVIRALALGANFVFSGRCFVFASAAGAEAGIGKAIALLRQETDRALGQIGCPNARDIDEKALWRHPDARSARQVAALAD
jgi:(S)-mandelate dehydrogenase